MSDTPNKPSKPSRRATQERLEAVADQAVGTDTALDHAFAVFDDDLSADPQRLADAQDYVRALLLPTTPLR